MATDHDLSQLEKLLAGAQLPALPQSAIRLFELSQDPNNSSAQFAVPIESDPGLTSQVLRFVNSSYFGFAHEISSVKLAISLVGIRTIKNFALWSAVFSLMPNPKCGPFDLKSLWQDSLRRAVFARRFGKLLGLSDAENLFAAALLQDMAVPLLAKELPSEYESLLERRQGGQIGLSELEASEFGWTHAVAGAHIARSWHLPEAFASLIESHGSLDQHVDITPSNREALSVSLSALLPTTVDEDWSDRERFLAAYERCAPSDAPPAVAFFELIDEEYNDFAPVLKLSAPAKSLAEWLAPKIEPAETRGQPSFHFIEELEMSLLRNRTSSARAESDMTPMVDVTFLLLIFFMVTAAFTMQRSMAVPQPTEGSGQPPNVDVEADIVVEVDEFNTFHVTADNWEEEAPSEHDLIRTLRRIREREAGRKSLNRLLVKANPDALHEKVVAALDSGAYVGIPEIGLLTLD